MNTYFVFAVAVSCLVAYVSADCAASCGQSCAVSDQACNLLPINVECPGLKALCDSSCSAGCQCLTTCEGQCPAADAQDPKSVVLNGACKTQCRAQCGAQVASANLQNQANAVKAQLAGVLAKVKALVSGATSTSTTAA